jgi:hypothetical protein
MITGEDYNISPLSVNQQVVKVKAVNRSSSGISRYFDLVDPTGKYSKTNLFADDGLIYKQEFSDSFRFKYATRTDIEAILYNELSDVLKSSNLKNFYYDNFEKIPVNLLEVKWYNRTLDVNQSTGYIEDTVSGTKQKVSSYTGTLLRFFTVGALIKFTAPAGYYFDKTKNNELVPGSATVLNSATFIWTKAVSIAGDGTANGTGLLFDKSGPIVLNDIVPNTAVLSEIIPAWRTSIESSTITAMVDLVFGNKKFGLRYDIETRLWKIITETNLNTSEVFSLGRQGDVTNSKADSSWLVLFTTDTEYYTVTSRLTRYIFESAQQVRFFFDSSDKIYDTRNNTVVKDVIKVLNINTNPLSPGGTTPFTYDRDWEITEEFRGLDGYVDTKKIQVTFNDSDDDGVVDDPTLFDQLVIPNTYIVLEKYVVAQGQEDYRYISNDSDIVVVVNTQNDIVISQYQDGQYFYIVDIDTVKIYDKIASNFIPTLDYKVFVGRDKIKFQYIHNADYESRIDPGLTNLIDVFVLTKQYDIAYRQWLSGAGTTEPLPPSSDFLYNLLSPELNKIKSISDEIVYHPSKYKVLFGSKATTDLQATFKVVKNSEIVISDNDIKTRVLVAILEFFALENWEFGDNFYFSELSTYVMNKVSPYIVNFVIVPKQSTLSFGGLYEIRSEKDQIFINGAGIDDIEIISTITASNIKSAVIQANQTAVSQQTITSLGSN